MRNLIYLWVLVLIAINISTAEDYLFSIEDKFLATLDMGKASEEMLQQFSTAGYVLAKSAVINPTENGWIIGDENNRYYLIHKGNQSKLNIYRTVIRIGSKRFPESQLLGEITAVFLEANTNLKIERKFYLGGTLISFGALREGEIDFYSEYTGTGWTAILKKDEKVRDPQKLYEKVQEIFTSEFNLRWLAPFGFNNTYALAVTDSCDAKTISDLAKYGDKLRFGFTHEFLKRPDGFPGFVSHYGLSLPNVKGFEHGLLYKAMAEKQIDAMDAYSTDGKLLKYKLKLLKDDRFFFPPYYAAPLIRQQTLNKYPYLEKLMSQLGNTIDDENMAKLNYEVEVERRNFAVVAREFLVEKNLISAEFEISQGTSLWELVKQHLFLTLVATGIAIAIGIPLGLLISRVALLSGPVLGMVGIIQTIPSLAILGFMIPLFGIGVLPAIVALFLYALLPIVRNTYTGITSVDPQLIEAAIAMGMTRSQVMFRLELPLATRVIMAGIRTATVINIGSATLAAFIGAGGLGEPIVAGLSLNDNSLILRGAIPAAVLALIVDFILARVENIVEPKGLRIQRQSAEK